MKYDKYNWFCVYMHCDPDTGEAFYIGKGSPARAYTVSPRKEDHEEFLESLLEKGHSLWEIVKICKKDLTNEQALALEKELILEHIKSDKKLFNIIYTTEPQPPPKKKGRPTRYKRHRKYKSRCWN